MVRLVSGDMVQFVIGNVGSSAGKALLRVIGRDDVPRIEKSGYGWNDGDTAVLTGSDVAMLLHVATLPHFDGFVVEQGRSGTSSLVVATGCDDTGGIRMTLVGDTCSATLNAPERVMLVEAIKSQVWRLFQ